jgi:mRNA-degrading endonuclease RelE of RelBE toxin-antitoxin system
MAALDAMRIDPFSGDIVRLHADERAAWRRRVGSYRIFFDVYPDQLIVDVVDIDRRTSTTYRGLDKPASLLRPGSQES